MLAERKEKIDVMSLVELENELNEVYGTIQNEKIWMFGSAGDPEAEIMHSNNVDELRSELRYIFELIEQKKKEVH